MPWSEELSAKGRSCRRHWHWNSQCREINPLQTDGFRTGTRGCVYWLFKTKNDKLYKTYKIQFQTFVWPIFSPLPNNDTSLEICTECSLTSQRSFYHWLLHWNSLRQEDKFIATTRLAVCFSLPSSNPTAVYAASKHAYHITPCHFS